MLLIHRLEQKYSFWQLVIAFLFLQAVFVVFGTHYLWIANSLMALPFYYAGYKYRTQITGIAQNIKPFAAWAFVFIGFVLTVLLSRLNGRVSMMGCGFGQRFFPVSYCLFYLNALVGSSMILLLSTRIRQFKFITLLSMSLISILGFQGLFVPFFIGKIAVVPAIIIALLIIVICYSLHQLTLRWFPRIYGNK